MIDDSNSGISNDRESSAPKSYGVHSFPDGRQFVQVYDLTLSIPKDTDKYYHAGVTFRDRQAEVKGILYNPRRQLALDGSGYIDCVYVLVDQSDVPPVTRTDAIQGIRVLEELSQEEYETVADGIKNMMVRKR